MLKYNSFRKNRYHRSKFVEGAYFLAQEAGDLELEVFDNTQRVTNSLIGDIAIDDAWKVEKYSITATVTSVIGNVVQINYSNLALVDISSTVFENNSLVGYVTNVNTGTGNITLSSAAGLATNDVISILTTTSLIIYPGESWQYGVPIFLRSGVDQTVDLGVLKSSGGITPDIELFDEESGRGKILKFNDLDTSTYRIVISTREEIVTNTSDPFLKNFNLSEATSQKVRLVYKINIVPEALQSETPLPYTSESASDGNLVNKIVISPVSGQNGELVLTTTLSGTSEEIDGRNYELTIRNDSGLGSRPIPFGTTDQQSFFNGTLVDSLGNEYHINAIFNDTVAGRVIFRIDSELSQTAPQLINGSTYTIYKRDLYVVDDSTGAPLGVFYWPLSTVSYNNTYGFLHSSKIIDLRNRIISKQAFDAITNNKFNLRLTDGGLISWETTIANTIQWTSSFAIINPAGLAQSIAANTVKLKEGSGLSYFMDIDNGGVISKGNLAITVSSGTTTLSLSGSPDLSKVLIGNLVSVGATDLKYIVAVDDINKTIIVDSAITAPAAGIIYLDSFLFGYVPVQENVYTLAIRQNNRIYIEGLILDSEEELALGEARSKEVIKVDFHDASSTLLPTGVSATIDGQSLANNHLVLFTNLSSNNNRVYKAAGVGTSITWTAQRVYEDSSLDPTDQDSVRIKAGTLFADQIASYDGTKFTLNDVVRYFDSVTKTNYWELTSLKTTTLIDNTTANVFSVTAAGSENMIVDYSIARSTTQETGQIYLTSDGTSVSIAVNNTYLSNTGIDFIADINAGNIRLRYTSTSTGFDATMKFFVKRWSNSPGGPSGIPNYISASNTVAAAGALGDVQFHGSVGTIAGNTKFKWDNADFLLNLNGFKHEVLTGPLVLTDNTSSPATIFTVAAADIKFSVIDYSLERDGDVRTGRLMLANNGTVVALSDDFIGTADLGTFFTAIIVGADVLLQYTTTSTGNNVSFKYITKRWS